MLDISFWLVIIGTLGLLALFVFKSWQLKNSRDMTSYLSASLEKHVQKGVAKAKTKLKNHLNNAKERATNGNGRAQLRSALSNNRMTDLIKGKKKLDYNGSSSSEFLNNMSDAKRKENGEN